MNAPNAFHAAKQAALRKASETGACNDIHQAILLLKTRSHLDKVNALCSGEVRPLKPRTLDLQPYLVALHLRDNGLTPGAVAHLQRVCDALYGPDLPAYVNIDRAFDPWNYQLCGCPTENHFFNDTSNRLAESIVFPDRVFSDGHSAAEYRPYWENAFQSLVATRVMHGIREWRSTVYCHVLFDDAMMIANLAPEGPTRDAAHALLDLMFLSIGASLRKQLWLGPHSRVYSRAGFNIIDGTRQCYPGYAACLRGDHMIPMIATSDYVLPDAIRRLPHRQDNYVSIEKTGPRYHPRGEGLSVFDPAPANVYLCRSDREDWGGDGILYNYLTPSYCLGSIQDWGTHDGTWHMHCIPWSLVLASDVNTDLVLSYAGDEEDATRQQGGYMTWPCEGNDQDATIFQYRRTLFSQMRAVRHEKFWENLPNGFDEAPWAPASGNKRLIGYREPPTPIHTRFYLAESLGPLAHEDGWVLAEKNGVCIAIRPVRGSYREEAHSDWILGQVFVCDIWDDVILCEVAESHDVGGVDGFRARLRDTLLRADDRVITFRNIEGDILTFRWKEDGDPTVNDAVPAYSGMRFNDPCIRSELDTGVIRIDCDGASHVIDTSHLPLNRHP